MDKEQLALEAARLKKDPVFLEAIARIRREAIERLVKASVDDIASILRLQSTVAVCDGLHVEMETMILSREEKRPIKAT